MDRNHYNIERSRKIAISIPGYDPIKESKKIDDRFKRIREKNGNAKLMLEAKKRQEIEHERQATEKQLTELNRSLTSPRVPADNQEAKKPEGTEECNLFQ